MMRRNLLVISVVIFTCQHIYGQPSFAEKRQRDKSVNEGISYIQQEQFELAAFSLTTALELDSTFAPARLLMGRILIEWGAMEEALKEIDKALHYNPLLGEASFYKGYILYGTDSTGLDRILFERAISHGYQQAWAYYFSAITRIRDDADRGAREDLDRAIEMKQDFALAYHERAGIKRREGDLQGAHFDYQQALVHDPDFALAYMNMGSVKIMMGDYAGAMNDYSKALELDPELGMALNNRGYARYFTGDTDGAMQDFNAAITNGTTLSNAKINKASLMATQGQVVPALDILNETILERPDEALLYLNRGLVKELMGDKDGACEDWHRALELGASEANAFIKECEP